MQRKNTDSESLRNPGLIIGLILSFFGYISKLARESYILSYFKNYNKLDAKCKNSFFARKINSISNFRFKLLPLKITCAEHAQESVTISLFQKLKLQLLGTSMRSYGIFMLSYGLFTVSVFLARNYDRIVSLNYSDSFAFGVILTVISLFILPVKKSLCSCITESKFISYILKEVLSFELVAEKYKISSDMPGISFILGLAAGALSYLTSPVLLAFVLFMTSVLYIIFAKPENGILLICLLIPFSSGKILTFFIAVTALSALFKIIRGKRSLHFNISSVVLILFGLIAVSAGMFSYDTVNGMSNISPYLIVFLLGILTISLVRSTNLAKKCFKMLSVSAVAAALFGFYDCIALYVRYRDFSGILSTIINHGMTSSFENSDYFGAYLICMMPILFLRFKDNTKLISAATISLLAICLVLSNSYYAIFSAIAAFVITMLIFSKHGLFTAFSSVFIVVFFRLMLPGVTNTSIGKYMNSFCPAVPTYNFDAHDFTSELWLSGAGAGNSSVAYASASHIDVLNGISGIGGSSYISLALKIGIPLTIICVLLFSVFISRIVSYALEKNNSPTAKTICSVLFCSVLSIIIYALFSDLILNFRMLATIILLASLGSATADSADNDYISPSHLRDDIYY